MILVIGEPASPSSVSPSAALGPPASELPQVLVKNANSRSHPRQVTDTQEQIFLRTHSPGDAAQSQILETATQCQVVARESSAITAAPAANSRARDTRRETPTPTRVAHPA